MNNDLIHDSREITIIVWGEGEAEEGYSSNANYKNISVYKKCDRIEVYAESDSSAWFRIIKDGETLSRINASKIREVHYKYI